MVLLAHGYPVLFFPPDTHGAPNRAMDPVMTQLLLAACGLPYAHDRLDHRVYTVDDLRGLAGLPQAWRALVDETGLLQRWCRSNGLDPDRYLHRIGFLDRDHRRVQASAPVAG